MSKYHVYPDEGGCKRGHSGLAVSVSDFHGMIASSRCSACERLVAAKEKFARHNAMIERILTPRAAPVVTTPVAISDDDYL